MWLHYFLQTDLHIHCEEWDRLLGSGVWEPEAIVRKMPEFLAFVKEVQGLVVSEESGLASAGEKNAATFVSNVKAIRYFA